MYIYIFGFWLQLYLIWILFGEGKKHERSSGVKERVMYWYRRHIYKFLEGMFLHQGSFEICLCTFLLFWNRSWIMLHFKVMDKMFAENWSGIPKICFVVKLAFKHSLEHFSAWWNSPWFFFLFLFLNYYLIGILNLFMKR